MPPTLLIDSDVLIEILSGARQDEEETIQDLFQILTPIDVDVAIADRSGEYLKKFRKSNALSIGDAVIDATAREMGIRLVTRNVRHYPMKDIKILKPY